MCTFSEEDRLQAHVVFAEYLTVCAVWFSFLGESFVFSFGWQTGKVMSVSISDIIHKVKILGNIISCIVFKGP